MEPLPRIAAVEAVDSRAEDSPQRSPVEIENSGFEEKAPRLPGGAVDIHRHDSGPSPAPAALAEMFAGAGQSFKLVQTQLTRCAMPGNDRRSSPIVKLIVMKRAASQATPPPRVAINPDRVTHTSERLPGRSQRHLFRRPSGCLEGSFSQVVARLIGPGEAPEGAGQRAGSRRADAGLMLEDEVPRNPAESAPLEGSRAMTRSASCRRSVALDDPGPARLVGPHCPAVR